MKITGPNIAALRAEQKPGCCMGCDEPLPVVKKPGRRRTALCGDHECWRIYDAAKKADRREQDPLGISPSGNEGRQSP